MATDAAPSIPFTTLVNYLVDESSPRYKLVRVARADEAWSPPALEARISYYEHRQYFYFLHHDGSVWHVKPRRTYKYTDYKPYITELLQGAWHREDNRLCDKIVVDSGIEKVSPVICYGGYEDNSAVVNTRAYTLLQEHARTCDPNTVPRGNCILYLHIYKLNKK